ncbi:hypothetical protein SERLADRAFT_443788 [Serpula lacrymans var. lacrymans S7.9]|uniref:Uncharacterized protein n=1 Tax=Serpula lacrymans var. lacrymans (strain S7.9) TaxID=578457 RepID=F8PDJ8_SERL9|nr:uncharacterized protein SERLADRAFT_443788 [Serpula lacrymans var. lacrymans S7.9]EGO18819.1 hypothetical protein SERLADRAFT_443788 [Serpula lacrymans var. lacrymans S7.9]
MQKDALKKAAGRKEELAGHIRAFELCAERSEADIASPKDDLKDKCAPIRCFFLMKKSFWLFQAWKSEKLLADLGNNALSKKPALSPSFAEALSRAKHQLVAEAGGLECWNSLLPFKRTKLELTIEFSMVWTLGQDAYLGLSEAEKHEAEFLGASYGADCEPTPAKAHALNKSSQGAVKAISLASRIFNNKDTYCWYMENRGLVASQFPDMSNVRFQSHTEAAEVVLMDHQAILEFLEFVQDKKGHRKLNLIEVSLYKALHCLKTIMEAVTIVIYDSIVLHPYLKMVWGPGTESLNVLDLGLLHEEPKQHLKLIYTNPKLIFGANVPPETPCFGGQPWYTPAAMTAAFKLGFKLEHLSPITLALF